MSVHSYLETSPLFELIRYKDHPQDDAVQFRGSPRKHPFSKDKLIFINDPLGEKPAIMEFKLSDIVHVEELKAIVNEAGESLPLVSIFVKRGALGMRLEPFEVQDKPQYLHDSEELQRLILRHFI